MMTVMMVAMLSVGFTACSDDDDNNNDGGGNTVVGTWSGVDEDGYMLTLTFNSNNTGVLRETYLNYSDYTYSFTYTMKNENSGSLTYMENEGKYYTYTCTFTLSGNTLILNYDGDTYRLTKK